MEPTYARQETRLPWSVNQRVMVVTYEFRAARRRTLAYDEDQVDRFLDGVAAAMDTGRPLPDSQVLFDPPRRFSRRGYDAASVDEFLDYLDVLQPDG